MKTINGITFDDVVTDDGGQWSQVCAHCVENHAIDVTMLDNIGDGVCGVEGCENESEYYIDFPKTSETSEATL